MPRDIAVYKHSFLLFPFFSFLLVIILINSTYIIYFLPCAFPSPFPHLCAQPLITTLNSYWLFFFPDQWINPLQARAQARIVESLQYHLKYCV